MSYVRASTDNPFGWRPGTLQLGYMSSGRQNGPNWKDVAAQHDAAIRMQRHLSDAAYRASMGRMNAIDRAARGDRTRVRMPRLSGLGLNAIDLTAKMVRGAVYVFHFRVNGTVIGGVSSIDPAAIASAVATDSNFSNPTAMTESGGFQISFTYMGLGSIVSGAASEMQDVLNTHAFNGLGFAAKAAFLLAEGGPAQAAPQGQGITVSTTNPDGTVIQFSDGSVLDTSTGMRINPDGSIANAASTTPAAFNATPGAGGSSFDLTSLVGGIGIGGAVALGLGAVILLKSL